MDPAGGAGSGLLADWHRRPHSGTRPPHGTPWRRGPGSESAHYVPGQDIRYRDYHHGGATLLPRRRHHFLAQVERLVWPGRLFPSDLSRRRLSFLQLRGLPSIIASCPRGW